MSGDLYVSRESKEGTKGVPERAAFLWRHNKTYLVPYTASCQSRKSLPQNKAEARGQPEAGNEVERDEVDNEADDDDGGIVSGERGHKEAFKTLPSTKVGPHLLAYSLVEV